MIGKYRMTLTGALVGPIWWPAGAICGKQLNVDLVREAERMDHPTMRDLLLHIVMENGGDFQSCDFTEDTEIVVTRDTGIAAGHRTIHTHYWPITAFKSVKDMVKEGEYAADYG